ncbi:V-type ATP synthase subunit E [Clostridium botulinum]|uniref:V-type proton ATPase subunit E n=1 Tax=Clostridium botulinum TaxID=1491 RepID=A0A0L9Y555_CLOBO|nr:V-type ATP synthase subunit E family protein [Clostridium botulinum]KAI3346547.1 V-type ATP synthase subunit E family protein [Clostridium botulinum]KOM86669.1 ATP synthase subunit E [Clostridium botulinum]KOR55832.1 ATP synthase subunit E [Clostridium botulinum]MBN1075240.1 V-type ATP synthase subunit E [Clostridium botulinum]MCS6111428.1 V-type ATP synthase subunit E [Clostridium botulinum]
MSNIDNLTSRIIKDAEDKKRIILSEAEEKKSKIIAKKQEKAASEEKIIMEKAETEAVAREERIISSAELQARNEKLKSKQTVISKVFETTIEELCNASSDDFKGFVKTVILNSTLAGDENLILNEQGKKMIDSDFVAELNREIGSKGNITLSDKTGNFKGGFILEKNGIEINNTFEALVSSLKDEMGLEVARVLFS